MVSIHPHPTVFACRLLSASCGQSERLSYSTGLWKPWEDWKYQLQVGLVFHFQFVRRNRATAGDSQRLLDDTGWQILEELQGDARLSFSELGRRVGLSTPAVTQRVRRMEDAGIITGYRAVVDPATVGLGM